MSLSVRGQYGEIFHSSLEGKDNTEAENGLPIVPNLRKCNNWASKASPSHACLMVYVSESAVTLSM